MTVELRCCRGTLTATIDPVVGELRLQGDGTFSAQEIEQAIAELIRLKDALETGVG